MELLIYLQNDGEIFICTICTKYECISYLNLEKIAFFPSSIFIYTADGRIIPLETSTRWHICFTFKNGVLETFFLSFFGKKIIFTAKNVFRITSAHAAGSTYLAHSCGHVVVMLRGR